MRRMSCYSRLPVPLRLASVTCAAAVVFMIAVLVIYARDGYYCGDAVQCTFQAEEMLRSRTMFPKSWIDTTFAHLQVIPICLGLRFSSSYVVANAFGGLVSLGAILVAFLFLWRKGLRDGSGLLLALFCLMPASGHALLQLYTGAFYAQCLVGMLVVYCSWLSSCFPDADGRMQLRPKSIALPLTVTFCCCLLLGVRMVVVVCLPVAAGVLWMSIFDHPSLLGNHQRIWTGVAVAVLILLASAFGCQGYEQWAAPAFGVPAPVACADDLMRIVASGKIAFSNLTALVDGTMRTLGFPFCRNMSDWRTIVGLCVFCASGCLSIVFAILELRDYRKISTLSRFVVMSAWFSFMGTAFILLFGNLGKGDEWNMCARYILLPGVFLLIAGVRYADRVLFHAKDVRLQLLACGLVMACASGMLLNWLSVRQDHRAYWQPLIDGLAAEGLDYGYATYENAMLPWFYSEGRVRIPHVTLEAGRLSIPGFCVAERWYDPESHVGPTFLMLTDAELARYAPQGLERTVLGEPKRTLRVGKYKVLVYDHNIAQDLFGTMNGPVKYLWGFSGQWVRNGSAKMEMVVPGALCGKDAELVLKVQSFGEWVGVFAGAESLGSFRFPPSDTDWSEKTVRLPVPPRLLSDERLKLRIAASGMKSPREHGWHKDKTKIGPHVLSAELRAPMNR